VSWPDEPFLNLRQIATPNGLPSQGGQLLYVKSDGKIYSKDASGVETVVGAGGDVTLAGSQTLTNKTLSADSNTLSGIAASSFVLSNGSGNIDGSAAQKVIPAGVVVGTTDTQTLTNKTLSTGTLVGGATTDISGAWSTYTPTLTNWTLSNGTMVGKYLQIGKTVHYRITYTVGSTDTKSGTLKISLPVTSVTRVTRTPAGNAGIERAGVGFFSRTAMTGESSNWATVAFSDEGGALATNLVPFTWATGDKMEVSGTYEAA
jgi:hypothetical protein